MQNINMTKIIVTGETKPAATADSCAKIKINEINAKIIT